ncbi:hypothetical protein E7T09_04050 [Deinococcus sp. KSM4-11]|uniref:hypothetical protein n=1 Tax=Deinococcus sp. KSM4-11 TaxID=2568654 RepID=UPI0010A3DE32|nr:hypothetical protein [Deinococcus sp. KSM4-11]THF88386.1 hypothetical protein E7T09_04050 [Deinococcus sp. KSM4-11]
MTDLNNEAKGRIEAEERYRAQKGAASHWPEDPRPGTTPSATPVKEPNYWLGFFLNFFFLGSGFTYINRIGWHFGWIGIALASGVVTGLLMVATPGVGSLVSLVSLLIAIGTMVHYRNTYAAEFARGSIGKPIDNTLKWVLIGGHIVLGFVLQVGILSAILIPNLMGARTRAFETGGKAYARQVKTAAMIDALDGKLKSGPCVTTVPVTRPDYVTNCSIDASNPLVPRIAVTLNNGRVITQP